MYILQKYIHFWGFFFIFCFLGFAFFTWKTFKRVKENFRIFIYAHFFVAATKWENWGVENIFRINNIWWRLGLDMDNTSNKIAYFHQTIVLKSIHVIDSNWMVKSIFIIKQLLHRLWNPITTKQSANALYQYRPSTYVCPYNIMDFVFRISSDVKAMEQTRTRLYLATIAYVTSQGVFLFNTRNSSQSHPTFFIQMKNISGKDIRTKEIQALVIGDLLCKGSGAVTMVSGPSTRGGFSTIYKYFGPSKWRFRRTPVPMDECVLTHLLAYCIYGYVIFQNSQLIFHWTLEHFIFVFKLFFVSLINCTFFSLFWQSWISDWNIVIIKTHLLKYKLRHYLNIIRLSHQVYYWNTCSRTAV